MLAVRTAVKPVPGGSGQNFPVLYASSNKHEFRFRGAHNVRGQQHETIELDLR